MFPSVARVMLNIIKVTADGGEAVRIAVANLKAGKVIAVPTDTVYGLAASAQDADAINLLYRIKARDKHKPVAICLSHVSEIGQWADISHLPEAMLKTLLPGAVTIVLKRGTSLNTDLNPSNTRVGVRIPNDAFITRITREFGGPIALSSANSSSEPSSLEISEFKQLWPMLGTVFDGGALTNSREASTVVDLSVPNYYQILRKGSALDDTLNTLKKYNICPLR